MNFVFFDSLSTALWTISWQVSILILFILSCQKIFVRSLSNRSRYGLWSLVLLRLIIPVDIQSPFSPYQFISNSVPIQSSIQKLSDYNVIKPTQEKEVLVYDNPSAIVDPKKKIQKQVATIKFKDLLFYFWMTGFIGLNILYLFLHFKLGFQIRNIRPVTESHLLNLLEDSKEILNVKTPVSLILSPHLNSPAIFGFVRPRLLIPTYLISNVDEQDLKFIFLHEVSHVKRYDLLINWCMTFLQTVYWFNPFLWLAFRNIRSDRELICDEMVLKTSSALSKPYGQAILKLLQWSNDLKTNIHMASILEPYRQMEQRMYSIANFEERPHSSLILSVFLFTLISITCINAHQSNPINSPSKTTVQETRNYDHLSDVLKHGDRHKSIQAIRSLPKNTPFSDAISILRDPFERYSYLRKEIFKTLKNIDHYDCYLFLFKYLHDNSVDLRKFSSHQISTEKGFNPYFSIDDLKILEQLQNTKVTAYIRDLEREDPELAKELLLNIWYCKIMVDKHENGHVVIGQIALDDSKDPRPLVRSQRPLLRNGHFAFSVHNLISPIRFRAHEYIDLYIPLIRQTGNYIILKKRTMKVSSNCSQKTVHGQVIFKETKLQSNSYLHILNPKANSHHGHTESNYHLKDSIYFKINEDGHFNINSFSPSQYHLHINPLRNYQKVTLTLDFSRKNEIDLGQIHLQSKIKLKSHYYFSDDLNFRMDHKPKVHQLTTHTTKPHRFFQKQHKFNILYIQRNNILYFYNPKSMFKIADMGKNEFNTFKDIETTSIPFVSENKNSKGPPLPHLW